MNLIRHFNGKGFAEVKAVFCNKKNAGVIEKAEAHGVPCRVFNRHEYYETETVIEEVRALQPDVVVLAGFLWLVPVQFIEAFEGKIINLHPSLLPKYGGKGMYGHFVHEAVLAAGEKETGITVHLVNHEFDKGEVLYQEKFVIPQGADVPAVEQLIHQLEHKGLPMAVETFLKKGVVKLHR